MSASAAPYVPALERNSPNYVGHPLVVLGELDAAAAAQVDRLRCGSRPGGRARYEVSAGSTLAAAEASAACIRSAAIVASVLVSSLASGGRVGIRSQQQSFPRSHGQ